MASKESKESISQALIDSIRNIAGVIGLLGGISYVTGYLIVNFYLGQFGVVNLSLVQSRYFASGALFLVVSLLICGGPLISMAIIDQSIEGKIKPALTRWASIALFITSLALAIVLVWGNVGVLTGMDNTANFARTLAQRHAGLWLALSSSQIALLFPFIVYYLVRWLFKKRRPSLSVYQPLWTPVVFGGLFVICILVSVFVFARFAYPNSSPSLGGGAPTVVQLIVTDNLSSMSNFPLKMEEGITEPVILIDQSSTSLLVLQQYTQQAIELSNREVIGVLHK